MYDANYFISHLNLEPHVEGGFYKEIYRSKYTVSPIKSDSKEERPASTTIYYLLRSGDVSKFHRLKFDEIWYHHYGSPIIIHTIDKSGNHAEKNLGINVSKGETPQVLVPEDTYFGAEVKDMDSFSLVSCMVSPGFIYDDFELFTREQLTKIFPQHKDIISKLNG